MEVEDIMCDQVIITNVETNRNTNVEMILHIVVQVYYTYLKNQKLMLENVRRQLLPNAISFITNRIINSLFSTRKNQIVFTPEKCVECKVLAGPKNPNEITNDVIFVHGLYGSLNNTWKQGVWNKKHKRRKSLTIAKIRSVDHKQINNKLNFSLEDNQINEPYSYCWPQDWLPKDCPGVRVIALNYTSDTFLWRPIWFKKRIRSSMIDRSEEMIKLLLELNVGKHPIIWVGHSKGGLFVKQILISSFENIDLQHLYYNTKGIMFYSVPHHGSSLANVHIPLTSRSIEVLEIQRNCNFLRKLHERFLEILDERSGFPPEIFSFVEMSLTLMGFLYLRIVPLESADPGLGLFWAVPLDHREICKPSSRKCFLYQTLVQLIQSNSSYNQIYHK